MCLPQMRRHAERRVDQIIEISPIGIVALDENLHIKNMNPAFKKMFLCTDRIIGREISYLINAACYEEVAKGEKTTAEAVRAKYGKRYHEIVSRMADKNEYIGFYLNLSKSEPDTNQLELIREQMVHQAKEILQHQVEFAQNLAQYLGESTAESEVLVRRMIDMYEEDN